MNSVRRIAPIEDVPNIGITLGQRLRAVGIATPSALLRVGDAECFKRLAARLPEEAGTHSRRALAGAVRGVRWRWLPRALRVRLKRDVP